MADQDPNENAAAHTPGESPGDSDASSEANEDAAGEAAADGSNAPSDPADDAEDAIAAAAAAIDDVNDTADAGGEPEAQTAEEVSEENVDLLDAVNAAINAINSGEDVTGPQAAAAAAAQEMLEGEAMSLPDFAGVVASGELPGGLGLLGDVNLRLKVELGRTRMHVEDVLKLGEGSVVELDKLAGDPVDIYVNDRPVARGEVLVLNDSFCVRINEIIAAGTGEAAA